MIDSLIRCCENGGHEEIKRLSIHARKANNYALNGDDCRAGGCVLVGDLALRIQALVKVMKTVSLTANVTQQVKDDLAVLAWLNGRSSRDEAGLAIERQVFVAGRYRKKVSPDIRAKIIAAASKKKRVTR